MPSWDRISDPQAFENFLNSVSVNLKCPSSVSIGKKSASSSRNFNFNVASCEKGSASEVFESEYKSKQFLTISRSIINQLENYDGYKNFKSTDPSIFDRIESELILKKVQKYEDAFGVAESASRKDNVQNLIFWVLYACREQFGRSGGFKFPYFSGSPWQAHFYEVLPRNAGSQQSNVVRVGSVNAKDFYELSEMSLIDWAKCIDICGKDVKSPHKSAKLDKGLEINQYFETQKILMHFQHPGTHKVSFQIEKEKILEKKSEKYSAFTNKYYLASRPLVVKDMKTISDKLSEGCINDYIFRSILKVLNSKGFERALNDLHLQENYYLSNGIREISFNIILYSGSQFVVTQVSIEVDEVKNKININIRNLQNALEGNRRIINVENDLKDAVKAILLAYLSSSGVLRKVDLKK